MKTKLFILLLLFPFVSFSQSFEYQGTGVFKAYQGDVITILPDTAFIINKQIFSAGLRAFEYVDSNQLKIQITSLTAQLKKERQYYNDLKVDYDSCFLKRQVIVNTLEIKIDSLTAIEKQQKVAQKKLDATVKEKDKLIEKLDKRVRRRTGFAFAALGAYLIEKAIDFFRD